MPSLLPWKLTAKPTKVCIDFVISAAKLYADKDIYCCHCAAAMIDKAKEVLGDADSITRLPEENLAIFKEIQRVAKELEAAKLELAQAKDELTSLTNKNASTVQDLKDQLSRRQDESTAVDEKLLGITYAYFIYLLCQQNAYS